MRALLTLGRIKKDEKEIEYRLTEDEETWKGERSLWISDLEARARDLNLYEKNLLVALQLIDPLKGSSVVSNDIKTLKRNLQAHVGFPHFSVKGISIPESMKYICSLL